MRVGDYVRTKKGKIGKIINYIDEPTDYYFNCYETDLKNSFSDKYITEYDNEIKSSPNIIDLIEVGDYVNGGKVVDKQYHYTDKDNYDMGEWCIFYENVALGDYQYEIKSIVTKEQFKSMKYKVGE